MRMGKGSGKLSTWYSHIYGGVFVVEFKNLRLGRAYYYSRQIQHKLPVLCHFTSLYTRSIKISGGSRTNPKHSILF